MGEDSIRGADDSPKIWGPSSRSQGPRAAERGREGSLVQPGPHWLTPTSSEGGHRASVSDRPALGVRPRREAELRHTAFHCKSTGRRFRGAGEGCQPGGRWWGGPVPHRSTGVNGRPGLGLAFRTRPKGGAAFGLGKNYVSIAGDRLPPATRVWKGSRQQFQPWAPLPGDAGWDVTEAAQQGLHAAAQMEAPDVGTQCRHYPLPRRVNKHGCLCRVMSDNY